MNNFTFPLGPAYNGTEYSILFTGNLVELICHFLLDCPFSALNFFLIFKTSILHPNLKVILLCQSACIFVRGIGRSTLIIGRLFIDNMTSTGPLAIIVLYFQPTFVRNFIIHVLVIERIMATFMSKTYEQWKAKWFNPLWIAIVFLIALFNSTCGTLISPDFGFLFIISTYISLIIFGIFEIMAFIWIWKYNDRLYWNKAKRTLSQRYQLAENIRTSRQLIPCIILHFFNLFDGAIVNFVAIYRLTGPNPFYYDLFCNQQIFIATSICGFLIELSMIIFHPFLKRDLFRFANSTFHFLANSFCSRNSADCRIHPRNQAKFVPILGIRGEQMRFEQNADEMSEQHFRQLNLAWQSTI